MSRLFIAGTRWRMPARAAFGVGAAFTLHRQQAGSFKLDTALPGSPSEPIFRPRSESSTMLSPEFIKNVSQGSISGFGAGLVVGVFSQALAVLAGLAMFMLHVAQKWGFDIKGRLRLGDRLRHSFVDKPFANVAFRLSFATTFMLAAFVRL